MSKGTKYGREQERVRSAKRPREGESKREIEMGNIEGTKRDQETQGEAR